MINLNTRTAYIETIEGKSINAKRHGNHWEVKLFKKGRLVKTELVHHKKEVLELAKQHFNS